MYGHTRKHTEVVIDNEGKSEIGKLWYRFEYTNNKYY